MKKIGEHEVDKLTITLIWNNLKEPEKKEWENWRSCEELRLFRKNWNSVVNDNISEESPGELKRLALTQLQWKPLITDMKTHIRKIIIIIIVIVMQIDF